MCNVSLSSLFLPKDLEAGEVRMAGEPHLQVVEVEAREGWRRHTRRGEGEGELLLRPREC